MNLALCKCGIDMTEHPGVEPWADDPDPLKEGEHHWDAAGTKYRCEELITTSDGIWLCPRPRYHLQEGVLCGPLTGEKLW